MGTVIEASAIARPDGDPSIGAIGLADAAARACLERARRAPDDVQLLINAGVYLDHDIQEPAIASMIQEDIGANPAPTPGGGQGTFSFDVRNGACGLLTGHRAHRRAALRGDDRGGNGGRRRRGPRAGAHGRLLASRRSAARSC